MLGRPEQQLLVAATGPIEVAVPAWQAWRADHHPDTTPPGLTTHFGMIARRLERAGHPDPTLDPSGDRRRDAAEANERLIAAAAAATAVLDALGVPAVTIKGAGLQHVFPEPGLRTMGDVDLVVPEAHARLAIATLGHAGWSTLGRVSTHRPDLLVQADNEVALFRDEQKLDLHWRPLHGMPVGGGAALFEHPRTVDRDGDPIHVPEPSVQLLVVLCHALREGSNALLRGLIDAAQLLRTGECDPQRTMAVARTWERVTPLRQGLRELARHVDRPALQAFAATVLAAGRPTMRDRVAQASRLAPPCRRADLLATLAGVQAYAPMTSNGLPPARPTLLDLQVGEPVEFSDSDVAPTQSANGWSLIEEWGMWTAGRRARLLLHVGTGAPAQLRFRVLPALDARRRQRVTVRLDGRTVATWRWQHHGAAGERVVPVPAGLPRTLRLELRIRHPVRPGPRDRRLLGLGVHSITLQLREVSDPA